ncbi:hypothetical protein [Niveispirillum sp. KHB5.9]|uniref:hypothetical protein n=1 Tax=Niveispirillum sp. KHB5.9 TaxID=3400269 RepID=UPI003A88216F
MSGPDHDEEQVETVRSLVGRTIHGATIVFGRWTGKPHLVLDFDNGERVRIEGDSGLEDDSVWIWRVDAGDGDAV